MKILFIVFMISFTCYDFIDTSPIEVATHIPTTVRNALENGNASKIRQALKSSRRIIGGKESFATRPYMVFLKLPTTNKKYESYRTWLCGGVIIHQEYILTSAACIEDTKYFYVVSGTYTHNEEDSRKTNICLKNSAKRATWKCVPRNYAFDGQENDNLKWMNNDIAIVKVEDEFDFDRRIRGCDFIPKPIAYNNQSDQLEEPGTIASVAGWGTISAYGDWVNSRRQNSKHPLRDAPVIIISKKRCRHRWGSRYNTIIDNYMICTRDYVADMTEICSEKYAECTDIMGSGDEGETRRDQDGPKIVHSAYHNDSNYRRAVYTSGGFCENDHGGPLVYSEGVTAVVIGVISACLVKEKSNKCYGPFLYTSVYKNRFLINCSLYKSTSNCESLFRSTGTHVQESISWKDHPDGPGKNEMPDTRRTSREYSNEAIASEKKTEQSHSEKIDDSLMQSGAILIKNNVTINFTSTTEILQTTSEASAATIHIE